MTIYTELDDLPPKA